MPDDDDIEPIGTFPVLPIPDEALRPFADRADIEWLPDDGLWVATDPTIRGPWATGATPDEARDEMLSVLREWVSAGVHFGHQIPAELRHAVASASSG